MAMNWGAALGAAVTTGLNTYERLGEEELREMQRQQLRKDIAEKEALDRAFRETQARVGQQDEYSQAIKTGSGMTNAGNQQAQMLSNQGALPGNTAEDQAFEKASAESAAGAMRENAVRQGALPTSQAALPAMKPTEYTADQGMKDYVKAAGQVSRKGALEAIQMKGVMRESNLQDKFDTEKQNLDDTLARIHGTAESGGLKGLYEAGKKEGLKLGFVEGKNGVGSRIQVLGPKGDVLETVSDVAGATQKLSDAAMNQFMTKSVGLLGSPDKVIAAMQGERKTAAAERSAQADIEYKGKGGVIDRAYSSGGKGGGKGSANSAENQEKVLTMKADTLMKGDPKRFKDLDQAKAWILNTQLKGYDAEKKWGEAEAKLIDQRASNQEISQAKAEFFSRQGIAPDFAVQAARSGIAPNGKPFTEADKQAFRDKYPNSFVEFGAPETTAPNVPAAAIPTKAYVPEPGSPAAKSAEKRQVAIDTAEKDKAAFKEKVAAAKSGGFNPSSQFEVDKGTMTSAALKQKYLPLQRALTPAQFEYLTQ